ncbi:MAG: DUF2950 family protein [Pseudomonadota bacterium]
MARILPTLLLPAVLLLAVPATAAPQAFETPEAAVNALVAALRAEDREAIFTVFGPETQEIVGSGDPERDRADGADFLAAYDLLHRIAEQEDGTARLYIGADQWPFPIRLVSTEAGWSFDAAGAAEEIQERRIGQNELDVIELLGGYVQLQATYRQTDYDGDGVMEFAAHILSTPGTRDGLYWPAEDGAPESPIGDFMARAAAEGFSLDGQEVEPEPYLGYYFHILPKQGESAPGGAMDYAVNGNMVAGHAIIAFPADYGETGVMSFMVAENGIVLEADLGTETIEAAVAIDSFEPGADWAPVE